VNGTRIAKHPRRKPCPYCGEANWSDERHIWENIGYSKQVLDILRLYTSLFLRKLRCIYF